MLVVLVAASAIGHYVSESAGVAVAVAALAGYIGYESGRTRERLDRHD
jgi:hypothetical protein